MKGKGDELPIFSHAYALTARLLERVSRFPRSLRPTLGHRVLERVLEILELLVDLRYTKERDAAFRAANLSLEKLRILVRLCHEQRIVSTTQYGSLAEDVDALGRMLGGWRRAEAARGGAA